ncbi:MAG: hypothetical protein ACSHX7_00490 [Luteolibacter sp.]
MKIEIFSIVALTLFGGSLFLEKVVTWGRLIPWWLAAAGVLATIFTFSYRSKIKANLVNSSFVDLLMNSLGIIVLVIGFLSRQTIPTIVFLLDVWLIILMLSKKNSSSATKSIS